MSVVQFQRSKEFDHRRLLTTLRFIASLKIHPEGDAMNRTALIIARDAALRAVMNSSEE